MPSDKVLKSSAAGPPSQGAHPLKAAQTWTKAELCRNVYQFDEKTQSVSHPHADTKKKNKKKKPILPEGRFYENRFPELQEIVVVKVKKYEATGAYVQLLEYGCRVGYLTCESTIRRLRPDGSEVYPKMPRLGRQVMSTVVLVDIEKWKVDDKAAVYIDLSTRKVSLEDAAAKERSFTKSKIVHTILQHVAGQNKVDIDDLCMKTSWPLHRKYGNAYEAFYKHINEGINVWDELDFSRPGRDLSAMAEKLRADIEVHLRRRLEQPMLRLRAKVEVSCPEFEGIDAVRDALLQGLRASKEGCEIKIQLLASPLFSINCSCRDKAFGIQLLEEAARLIKESIELKGGSFFLRAGPAISGHDGDNDYPDESGSDSVCSTLAESDREQDAEVSEARGEARRKRGANPKVADDWWSVRVEAGSSSDDDEEEEEENG